MSVEELEVRISTLEKQLLRVRWVAALTLLFVAGLIFLREAGWYPLKGSSLHIEDGGGQILTVGRFEERDSFLWLWGDRASVSLTADEHGASLHLKPAGRGGSTVISAGGAQSFASFSSPEANMTLAVGWDGPELYVSDTESSEKRRPRMPE